MSETPPPDSAAQPAIAEEKIRLLFALLFSSPEAVTLDRIREVLYPEQGEQFSPQQHLTALQDWMGERNLPLALHKVGRAWRLLTSEDVAEELITVRKQVHKDRMGPAALEVLSLVAYRQPVLKADIDAVRGVKSGPHLRHLLDMRLIRILGRSELPGRPFLYGTTREFLDRFGLAELKDLPEAGRLANPAEAPPVEPAPSAESEAAPEASSEASQTDAAEESSEPSQSEAAQPADDSQSESKAAPEEQPQA